MSVQTIEAKDGQTCLFCSVSMWAFGPVMGSAEEAEKFLKFCKPDPRTLTDAELEKVYVDFVQQYVCECGTVRQDETDCSSCKYEDPKDATGMHYGEEGERSQCYAEPAPAQGERYRCPSCVKSDRVKEERRLRFEALRHKSHNKGQS